MSSSGSPSTESPSGSTCSTPSPGIMRSVSFPLSDDGSSSSISIPTPRSMSMSDAQWLAAVRSNARKLYLQSTVHKIPCVKPRQARVKLEVDTDDEEDDEDDNFDFTLGLDKMSMSPSSSSSLSDSSTLVGSPTDETAASINFDEKEDADAVSKLSEAETTASATRVKSLLQRMSCKMPKLTLKIPGKDKDAKPPQEVKDTTQMEESASSEVDVDWSQPEQLEHFLARCVEGWEMQAKYIAHQARMQRAMLKMQKRMAAMEDQTALLAWYANHLKGDDASSTPPSPTAILQEAEAAVLKAAASTLASAADSLEQAA